MCVKFDLCTNYVNCVKILGLCVCSIYNICGIGGGTLKKK